MSFTMRLAKPGAGNSYYITKAKGGFSSAIQGSPTDSECNVLANCVGYAYGRFNEIGNYGSCKYLSPTNAENFIQMRGNLSYGQTPQVGACMVWQKGSTLSGSDGAGHVAIVERVISSTQILTSESGYNSSPAFWTKTRNKGDGNWGQGSAYKFLGFIYNPAVSNGSNPDSKYYLCYGLYGEYVKELQTALVKLGYSCGSAGADGDFGSGTLSAVKKFQSAKSLTTDGIVGEKTWAAIETALNQKTTTSTTKTTTATVSGMKYSSANPPLQCMMTQSTCYKGTTTMQIKGILWHSTGANNNTLKRYVQPDDDAENRSELLAKIGTNSYKNDWNHISVQAGVNAWIGKLADGTVTTVQTLPWNYKPWGCGSGSKGSCNNGWIQFEICEDSLTDETYFKQVYEEAAQLTAYLCKTYNLDPTGTTTLNGVTVPVILCHKDSYNLNLGSGHEDILHWFPKFGVSMDDIRNRVAQIMGKSTSSTSTSSNTTEAYKVRITAGALNVRTGPGTEYSVKTIIQNKGVYTITEEQTTSSGTWGKLKSGAGWINLEYADKI